MAELDPIKFRARDGREIILRSPVAGEGAAILDAVRVVMRTSDHLLTEADEFNYTVEQEEEMIRSYAGRPNGVILVPECEGKIFGMLNFDVGSKRRNSHVGEFGMSLLPEFRHQGIGREMLKAFLAWAKTSPGVEKVNLRVHGKNAAAIKLYEKTGFREEGREIRGAKLGPNLYDDVIMMTQFIK